MGPDGRQPAHGEMGGTHTGNPLCCVATMANIQAIRDGRMVENAASLEPVVQRALEQLQAKFPERVGCVNGKGLAWAVYLVDPMTGQLDPDFAVSITTRCMELGLLMLRTGRGTLKIAPPLCITEDAMLEGISVIETALSECA